MRVIDSPRSPREDPVWRTLLLVFIAGFVDAVGFLALAGTFVAFMSGNTSAGGALASTLDDARALRQLFPLPFFVAGIYAGGLVVQMAPAERQYRRYAMVLAVEGALIALVLLAAMMAGIRREVPLEPAGRFFALAAPLAVAMGLQNAMRLDVRGARLATTYVTGTLHVAAQALARATVLAWPSRVGGPAPLGTRTEAGQVALVGLTSLMVWAGFLVGAMAGGLVFVRAGLLALVVPLAVLSILVMDTFRQGSRS
ncbi:MAG: YoaK family protein [Candidatus Rokuibacteriota bacterium]